MSSALRYAAKDKGPLIRLRRNCGQLKLDSETAGLLESELSRMDNK